MTVVGKPRAKRLTRPESKALTRTRVLAAAARVFARRGFNGASVEEVAEAAGFSKGAVYSNFESKDELFLALLDERMDAKIETITAVLSTPPALERRLGVVDDLLRGLQAQERDWCLLATEFWLYAMRNPRVRHRLAARWRLTRERLAKLIERYGEETQTGLARPAEDLASTVMALSDGLAMQKYLDPKATSDDLVSFVLTSVLHPLTAPGEPELEPR